MSETIRTVEIAAAIGTAITAQVGTLSIVPYIRWSPDRNRTKETDDSLQRPCVAVSIGEPYNNQGAQNTRLRDVDVEIVVETDYVDDPGQVVLAEICAAVGDWINSPPALTLTTCNFRRLSVVESAGPLFDTINGGQAKQWRVVVGIMYPTS